MASNHARAETRRPAQQIKRRSIMKGAAWATPVVAVGTAAPAFAASGNVIVAFTGCTTVQPGTLVYARLTFTVTVVNIVIPIGTTFRMAAIEDGVTTFSSSGSIDHYGGTLKDRLEFVSGNMWCLSEPCEETLRAKTPISPGTYTLSVDVAIDTNPTTVRLVAAPLSNETSSADNQAQRKVYKQGVYTSCIIP